MFYKVSKSYRVLLFCSLLGLVSSCYQVEVENFELIGHLDEYMGFVEAIQTDRVQFDLVTDTLLVESGDTISKGSILLKRYSHEKSLQIEELNFRLNHSDFKEQSFERDLALLQRSNLSVYDYFYADFASDVLIIQNEIQLYSKEKYIILRIGEIHIKDFFKNDLFEVRNILGETLGKATVLRYYAPTPGEMIIVFSHELALYENQTVYLNRNVVRYAIPPEFVHQVNNEYYVVDVEGGKHYFEPTGSKGDYFETESDLSDIRWIVRN